MAAFSIEISTKHAAISIEIRSTVVTRGVSNNILDVIAGVATNSDKITATCDENYSPPICM